MKYGICNLSIVPLRAEAADSSELVTQVLYGEVFKVLESRKKWSRIRLAFDGYEAWIDNKQFLFIEEENYNDISRQTPIVCEDLVDMISTKDNQMLSIVMGSSLNGLAILNHDFEGSSVEAKFAKDNLIDTALLYLNTPYLWGGKTPFGIDCSG
ncbi:MAG: SH3 domain-containing protein, partial [Flavobacteriales bacterium]